jgi:hypothetical protein
MVAEWLRMVASHIFQWLRDGCGWLRNRRNYSLVFRLRSRLQQRTCNHRLAALLKVKHGDDNGPAETLRPRG